MKLKILWGFDPWTVIIASQIQIIIIIFSTWWLLCKEQGGCSQVWEEVALKRRTTALKISCFERLMQGRTLIQVKQTSITYLRSSDPGQLRSQWNLKDDKLNIVNLFFFSLNDVKVKCVCTHRKWYLWCVFWFPCCAFSH